MKKLIKDIGLIDNGGYYEHTFIDKLSITKDIKSLEELKNLLNFTLDRHLKNMIRTIDSIKLIIKEYK